MPVFGTSKPVSRVLSFKTAIYLDAPLPTRSSRLPGTVGPTYCPSTALLRIEFTAMDCSQPSGELLPRLSTLTALCGHKQRYISVALFLRSPSADVIRYPCPVQPGLSSCPKARDRLHQSQIALYRKKSAHRQTGTCKFVENHSILSSNKGGCYAFMTALEQYLGGLSDKRVGVIGAGREQYAAHPVCCALAGVRVTVHDKKGTHRAWRRLCYPRYPRRRLRSRPALP